MSKNNEMVNDDECDSSFLFRTRTALVIVEDESQLKQQEKVENGQRIDIYNEEPLNLSIKSTLKAATANESHHTNKPKRSTNKLLQFCNKYTFHTKNQLESSDQDDEDSYLDSEDEYQDKINTSLTCDLIQNQNDDDDDLKDLSWLINYNISENIGKILSDSDKEQNDINLTINKKKLTLENRPNLSYSQLIYMAIDESPRKRLSLKQIYSWIMTNYPYFKQKPLKLWNNSIKHNLMNNDLFKKVDKSLIKSHGTQWTINSLINPQQLFIDVPETLSFYNDTRTNNNRKQLKSSPKITNVTKSLNDFYKKACSQSTSSDVDAANALLLFKSSNKKQKISPTKSKNNVEKSPQQTSRRKIIENFKHDDFSTDSELDFSESEENLSSLSNTTNDSTSQTNNSDLRNALLELSRAAELIEDKN